MSNEYACPKRSECYLRNQGSSRLTGPETLDSSLPRFLHPLFQLQVCDAKFAKVALYIHCPQYNHLVSQDDLGLSESFPGLNPTDGLVGAVEESAEQ